MERGARLNGVPGGGVRGSARGDLLDACVPSRGETSRPRIEREECVGWVVRGRGREGERGSRSRGAARRRAVLAVTVVRPCARDASPEALERSCWGKETTCRET